MGLVDLASRRSQMRGLDYYESGAVRALRVNGRTADAEVAGRSAPSYRVHLDFAHPRNSSCTCSFAEGRRVVCKHMVAAYYAAFPEEVERYLARVQAEEEEAERARRDLQARTERRIDQMNAEELREALWFVLDIADDWVYERFQREYL